MLYEDSSYMRQYGVDNGDFLLTLTDGAATDLGLPDSDTKTSHRCVTPRLVVILLCRSPTSSVMTSGVVTSGMTSDNASTGNTRPNSSVSRSLSCLESNRPRTQLHSENCDSLLSHVEVDDRPQSGSVSEPQQIADNAVSTTPTAPRTVKTRRFKKASRAAVYAFADPLSKATRSLNLSKLARSEFDWRTLTAIRPTTEFEERFITRLVELERLQASTIEHEERYYRRLRPCLQTATQSRLDIPQRLMKHSNSDAMLLSRRDSAIVKLSSSAEYPVCPTRRELTTTFPSTSTQDEDQTSREHVDTHPTHVNSTHSLASSSAASVHLLVSLCDVTATSSCDARMTSSGRLQRRRAAADKSPAADSDTSDCRDDLVRDLQLLDVSTTLPDLATTVDDSAQPDVPARRRSTRCKVLAGGDKTRRKTSAVAVQSRLTCIARSKRRARVHAIC